MRRAVFAICVAAVALAAAPPVSAQSKKGSGTSKTDPKLAEAKRLFDEGAEAYSKGNYDQAIELFQKSYDLSKKPLIFESIANAYERLGDPRSARDYLGKWRDVAPKDELDLLDQRLKNLDARITREDEAIARKKAEEAKARADLEAKARRPVEPEVETPKASTPPATIALLIGGGVLVATGVVLDLVAVTQRPPSDACKLSPTGVKLCLDADRGAVSTSNTLATVGDITWITGAVALGTGIVLYATRRKPEAAAKPDGMVTPIVTPRFGGLAFRQTF